MAAHWTKFPDPESGQTYWYNQASPALPAAVQHLPLHKPHKRSGCPARLPACLPACLHSNGQAAPPARRSRTASAGRSPSCRSGWRLMMRGATSSLKRVRCGCAL